MSKYNGARLNKAEARRDAKLYGITETQALKEIIANDILGEYKQHCRADYHTEENFSKLCNLSVRSLTAYRELAVSLSYSDLMPELAAIINLLPEGV